MKGGKVQFVNILEITKKNLIKIDMFLGLRLKNIRKLPAKCTQLDEFYLDLLKPEYNIIKIAGSPKT